MGPTWRADVWTVLERTPELSVAEVARRAGCSFAALERDARPRPPGGPRRATHYSPIVTVDVTR